MTPQEMGEALGPEWGRTADPWEEYWQRRDPSGDWSFIVEPAEAPSVRVMVRTDADGAVKWEWMCPTPDAAIAVAHLLVAAERIACGDAS